MAFRVAPLVVLILLLLPAALHAQGLSIYGTVTNVQHEPIAGADVHLQRGSVDLRATTDRAGSFRLGAAPEGTYRITVSVPGYEPLRKSPVKIGNGEPLTIVLRPTTVTSLSVVASVATTSTGSVAPALAPVKRITRERLQEASSGKLSEVLAGEAALTPVRPAGGGSAAPFSAALRGPDPTETLVAIDGHPINSGATGTFDLSLIDPAILDEVELIYGIAPSSLVGPDTIGGSINVRTMEPTEHARSVLRGSYGSFDSTAAVAETTATQNGIGYVAAVDSYSTGGDVRAFNTGSATSAQNVLVKLRTPVAQMRGFVQLTALNQNADRDISSALSSIGTDGSFVSYAGSRAQDHNSLLGLDFTTSMGPLSSDGVADGTLTMRFGAERDDQSVSGPASNISQTFFNYAELTDEGMLQYDRAIGKGNITLQYSVRASNLTAPFTGGGVADNSVRRRILDAGSPAPIETTFQMGETARSAALRYRVDPTDRLHYSAALYASDYSTFGRSVDPRFGFAWTPTRRTSAGFSIGSTFQAPQLTELYVPTPLPPIDSNGPDGIVSIGNPKLGADRATEYALNVEHIFGSSIRPVRIAADLYQSNLRNTIVEYTPSVRPAYSYPVNVGQSVYRGMELTASVSAAHDYEVTAEYVVNSAFPGALPPSIGGGALVAGQQFQGTPLHRASFEIAHLPAAPGLSYRAQLTYEGTNNELNRPPFAVVNAQVIERFKQFDIELSAANIFNVYADRFTLTQRGVPYPGPDGPIATDAYSLPARTIMLTVSKRL